MELKIFERFLEMFLSFISLNLLDFLETLWEIIGYLLGFFCRQLCPLHVLLENGFDSVPASCDLLHPLNWSSCCSKTWYCRGFPQGKKKGHHSTASKLRLKRISVTFYNSKWLPVWIWKALIVSRGARQWHQPWNILAGLFPPLFCAPLVAGCVLPPF